MAVDDSIVVLAKRLIDLDAEATAVRNEMRKLLANGEGAPVVIRPTSRRAGVKRPNGAPGGKRAKTMAAAAAAERQIVALLAKTPLRLADVVKATAAKATTTQARLRRLAGRNLVRRDGGLWSSLSTSSS